MRAAVPVALALLLLTPVVAAEFGPETSDGYPIGITGNVHRPPVPPTTVACELGTPLCGVANAYDPLNKQGGMTFYPYYPLLVAELQRLAEAHPDLVKLTSAGKSTAGLDLWLLEIADHARVESGEGIPLEAREVMYIDGGTHSNEYSGVYFVTEIAQFLLDEYETNATAKWIVENRHIWILPMINVDGSNAFGRLNAKTVNINRNFPATWGTVDEMPVVNNPGPEPESEAETRIVTALMDKLQPDYVNSIHCCGNLWLHPWGAEELENPEDLQMYTRICDEVFADVRDDCGEIWSTIYPASGTTADEGYGRVGASSWTYEMSGRGRVAGPWAEPVTQEDVRVQEIESWNGVMHAFLNVHKYGARPEIVAVEGDAGTLRVTLQNIGYGNLTAGELTVGGAKVALPWLAPDARATVEVAGSFAAGEVPLDLQWTKRHHLAPQGWSTLVVPLVAEGDRLVGVLDGLEPASVPDTGLAAVPAAGLVAALVAVAAVALAARRK